jgi:hypothetical protein
VPSARLPIILACVSLCNAQPAGPPPASPPKVLLLVRQQFKPEKTHTRERLERAASALYNRLEVPLYWVELQAFAGPSEALFLEPLDSFEALEKAGAILEQLHQEHPELVRMEAGINDALSSQTTVLAVRRDSPGVTEINLAQARFLRMLVVRAKPDEQPPVLDNASIATVVYHVNSGMPERTFLIFQVLKAFADVPAVHTTTGTIIEDSVYAIEPEMSHVSRAFAEQNSTFWMKPAGQ